MLTLGIYIPFGNGQYPMGPITGSGQQFGRGLDLSKQSILGHVLVGQGFELWG